MELRAIVGAGVVASAAVLLTLALRARRRDRAAVGMILAAALLLRLFTASDPFLHDWDERYHALVAKHLATDPLRPTLYADPVLPYDPHDWLANHVWLHKEPGALWATAACIRLLGAHELVVRIPGVLLSTLAVGLTFAIGRTVAGSRAGLVAAALHAMNGLLIELAAGRVPTDQVDSVFVAVAEFGVWVALATRRQPWWAAGPAVGVVAGAAALTKSVVSTFAVGLASLLAMDGTRRGLARAATLLVTGILATAAVYGPWHAYVDRAFPQEAAWERQYNLEHLGSAVEGHDGPWWYHLGRIPRYFGELAPLSLLWFLSRLPRGERRIERAFVAAWWFVPYAFFSAVATRMPGYAMVAAPAIFVMIGCHWVALRDRLRGAPGPGRWLAGAACVLLLALPARYGVERVKPLDSPPWDRAEARAMERLGDRLAGPPTVVFRAERPIELMFHADLIAYPQFPSLEEVALAVDRGYRVVVLDHGDAPAWLREDPRVTLLEP